MPDFPAEIEDVIYGQGKVSSQTIDDFLSRITLSAGQLDAMADVLFDRVIFDGKEKAIRRGLFRGRVKNGMTLKALAAGSPFSCKRLEDIEAGNFQSLSSAECNFFSDIFGFACIPDTQQVFSEPDEDCVLLTLNHLSAYDGTGDFRKFAESACVRSFDRRELSGLSGVVVTCGNRQVGFPGDGELLMKVSEMEAEEENGEMLCLCSGIDSSFKVVSYKDNCRTALDGSRVDEVSWELQIKKLIYREGGFFAVEDRY